MLVELIPFDHVFLHCEELSPTTTLVGFLISLLRLQERKYMFELDDGIASCLIRHCFKKINKEKYDDQAL